MKAIVANKRLWLSRALIGAVFAINLQCALLFIWQPGQYSAGFELDGATGAAAVRGIGILFLMWNVPYAVALVDPCKHRVSLYQAIAMQAIGLAGESFILWSLPIVHQVARQSVTRFIIFDGAGLVALLLAAWVSLRARLSVDRKQDWSKPS